MVVANQKATLWQSKFTDTFQWVSQDAGCLPLSTSHQGLFFTTLHPVHILNELVVIHPSDDSFFDSDLLKGTMTIPTDHLRTESYAISWLTYRWLGKSTDWIEQYMKNRFTREKGQKRAK